MKMNEDYVHTDCNLIYIDENIPGPLEDSVEHDCIVSKFNSQLTNYCNCDSICSIETCNCLKISGYANYEIFHEAPRFRLNFVKNIGNSLSYPIIECNSLCKCSEYCGNRVVQQGPIKGLVVKTCSRSSKGEGLFTTQFIPKGAFICEYAGEIITAKQAKLRHEENQTHGKMNYIFCLNEYCSEMQMQMFVDPSRLGNLGRYINHSCEPNCVIMPVRVETPLPKLAIFSQINIPCNYEITYDYGSNNLCIYEEAENRKICLCGSKTCRGSMPFDKY